MPNSFITKEYAASVEQREEIMPFIKSIGVLDGEVDTVKLLSLLKPYALEEFAKKNGLNMHAVWSAIQYLLIDHTQKQIELVFLWSCVISDEGILDRDTMLQPIKELSNKPKLMQKEAQELSIQPDLFRMAIEQILKNRSLK